MSASVSSFPSLPWSATSLSEIISSSNRTDFPEKWRPEFREPAGLFSLSHYVFWDYWYQSAVIMVPTLVSTFVMGVLWMAYTDRTRNIIYPILSHLVVDVLNLSVAVYAGIVVPHA
ncbi:MAG: type II CAAX prenyl endopeptidase Rce1 family protein [Spirochaetota bacterium]